MTSIVLHDGKAHQDDFLAACVLIHKLNAPAYRRSFTQDDLNDKDVWVLDQGREHSHDLHNFDHHQLDEAICSFTMVLDYFYQDYRSKLPQLRYVEIFDSCGPNRAAEFAEAKPESLEVACAPAYLYLIKAFSKVSGEIKDPFYSVMGSIGKEICEDIENSNILLNCLEQSAIFFEHKKIKILDTTSCKMPDGFKHDQLPTKEYSKLKNMQPDVVLTIDTRQGGYRMVSINSDVLKFKPNDKSHFTHVTGFLTGFKEYDDYKYILNNHIEFNSKNA